MRFALDTQSTMGRKTGIGQYSARLLGGLRQAAQDEFLALDYGRDVVMRLDRRLRWQQWDLPRMAGKLKADLLHVTGFDAPLRKRCPVVLTVHDLIGMLFPANLPPVSRFYWGRWLPFTIRFADAIIADSECTRRDLIRLTGAPSEGITVVPLGVEEAFRPQPQAVVDALRARYALPRDFVLYVGTIEPRKGIDTLVDAFAGLARDHPHHLVIAGKRGWYWEPILKRIGERKVEERVRVLDYVPDDDIPALYAAASVLAFPSHYEGFGLPVLEAMACGTPVVCSNTSSLPEVAGEAAVLVPPGQQGALLDALVSVLDDAALAEGLRKKGICQAQRFSWRYTAEATLGVYRAVTGSQTRSNSG